MDKAQATTLRSELQDAVEKIVKRYPGVEVKLKGGTYSGTEFSQKVVFEMNDSKGRTKEEAAWEMYAEDYGLDIALLGTTVRGKKIVGLDTRKRKYPVILIDEKTGKSFKAPVSSFAGVM